MAHTESLCKTYTSLNGTVWFAFGQFDICLSGSMKSGVIFILSHPMDVNWLVLLKLIIAYGWQMCLNIDQGSINITEAMQNLSHRVYKAIHLLHFI